MARSHDQVTRPSSTGDSSSVETADEEGVEPLTAVTICETAWDWAGSATTSAGACPAVEATTEPEEWRSSRR